MKKEIQSHIESQNIVVSKFLDVWRNTPNLSKYHSVTGTGTADDLHALQYMVYENILREPSDTVPIATAIVSKLLINYADFGWHFSNDELYKGVVLKHNQCGLFAPVYELCMFRATSNNQIDEFPSQVYFDVLFSCTETTYSHPLIAASLTTLTGEQPFKERFGYELPENIISLYNLYSHHDEEFLIRRLGLEAYDYLEKQKWNELERGIKQENDILKSIFGKDWEKRAVRESNVLE